MIQLVWLLWYYYTGYGGPQELVARVLSIALILQILFMYQQDYLYKFLPARVNHAIVLVYIGICVYAFIHFHLEFEQIAIWRQGSYTQAGLHRRPADVPAGDGAVAARASRRCSGSISILVFYTLYGYLSPIDFFWHPGTTFYRVVTSSTIELSTGIYGIYGQLALTLVAAFLLLAAAANGFGAQTAMIQVMRRLAGRSRQLVPQTAVLGSLAVGMVSGSGSANAAVVGTITIPLMKRYGVPAAFAAAAETAASMGGLIMPPMMGVGAFLMSDFLNVPYWEVVKRGFALAFVYYASIALRSICCACACCRATRSRRRKCRPTTRSRRRYSSCRWLFLVYQMGVVGQASCWPRSTRRPSCSDCC